MSAAATVVDWAAVLLDGLGSGPAPVTFAVAVRVPVALGLTAMVMVAEPVLARAPTEQVTVGAAIAHVPCDGLAEPMVRATPDSVMVARTPVAGPGPLLVTVTV